MYRSNVTNDQQEKVESAANDSGIPFLTGPQPGSGVKKIIPANGALKGSGPAASVSRDAVLVQGSYGTTPPVIGSHNDQISRFVGDQIGRA